MSDKRFKKFQNRIEQLEQRVLELEQILKIKSTEQPELEQAELHHSSAKGSSGGLAWDGEWLNRVGILLLLMGLAFLFKYSIDQGWLIPEIRSTIGLITGVVLLGFGFRMNAQNNLLRPILIGGGIAAFYLTGFATFQLFSFMSASVSWSFMILVTVLSLWLSVGQDEAILSVVGTLGALGTPFMLYTGDGEVTSLMLYFVLILSASSVIYILKGWRSLLWSTAMGGISILLAVTNQVTGAEMINMERLTIHGGIVFWSIACWLIPVFREIKLAERFKISTENTQKGKVIGEEKNNKIGNTLHVMILGVPLVGLMVSMSIGEWGLTRYGLISLGIAVTAGGFYWFLREWNLKSLASAHLYMGLVMATAGLIIMLKGDFLFPVLVIEMMALRYITYRIDDHKLNIASHLLYGIMGFWLLRRLNFNEAEVPFLMNMTALPELGFLLIGGLWIPRYFKQDDLKNIYRLTAHLLLLIWLYAKLSPFDNGQAWVSLSWGLYAITLLVLGLKGLGRKVHLAGFSTVLLVVLKLFIVDLSQLQAIWRILLFMGFGTLLLTVGYLFQSKWIKET